MSVKCLLTSLSSDLSCTRQQAVCGSGMGEMAERVQQLALKMYHSDYCFSVLSLGILSITVLLVMLNGVFNKAGLKAHECQNSISTH